MAKERHADALLDLNAALELTPGSYKLHRLRSMVHACLENFEKSLEDAERVIALQPASTDGYYHKGYALYKMRDFVAAAATFNEGLKLNPIDKSLTQGFWDALTLLHQQKARLPVRREDGAYELAH